MTYDRDEVIELNAYRLRDDAEVIEKWFETYDLKNPAQAIELGCALIDAARWPNPPHVANLYASELEAELNDSIYEFFGNHGISTKWANELAVIIDESTTPLAYESLHEFCLVWANESEIERAMSLGEP